METSEIIIGKIKGQGLLPLFYHQDPGVCVEVCKALYEADILLINLHTSCRHEIHIGKQFFYP